MLFMQFIGLYQPGAFGFPTFRSQSINVSSVSLGHPADATSPSTRIRPLLVWQREKWKLVMSGSGFKTHFFGSFNFHRLLIILCWLKFDSEVLWSLENAFVTVLAALHDN